MTTTDDQGGVTAAASTVRDQAAGLAQSAAESGQGVLHEATGQASDVVHEATDQARDLLGEARAGLTSQAADQQTRAAQSLRALGEQLGQMADGADQGGLAVDLVRQVAGRTGTVARWLEDRQPGDVLSEVADFARRRPGTFLGLAAAAGLLAGRLTRGLKDATSDGAGSTDAVTTGTGGLAGATAGPGAVAGGTGGYTETTAVAGGYATGAGYAAGGTEAAPITEPVATPQWAPVDPDPVTSEEQAWAAAGGEAPVTGTPGHLGSDEGGTAGGDPLAGVRREDLP